MIQIAAYRGIGLISAGIKLATYSRYSHIGIYFSADMEVFECGRTHQIAAGNVIEAWQGGVKLSASLSERHTKGTPVDLFSFKTPLTERQEQLGAQFLIQQLGKPYDYINVVRFLPIVRALVPKPAPSVWTRSHVFCSELGLEFSIHAGRTLLERCDSWQVPPRDLPRSPLLMFDRTVFTA